MSAARRLFRLSPAHAFGHKLLCLFLQVETHLLGEIAVECLATEDTR